MIVSFRLDKATLSRIKTHLKDRPVLGIRSENQFMRKLAVDWANGRLVYLKKTDEVSNPQLT